MFKPDDGPFVFTEANGGAAEPALACWMCFPFTMRIIYPGFKHKPLSSLPLILQVFIPAVHFHQCSLQYDGLAVLTLAHVANGVPLKMDKNLHLFPDNRDGVRL